MIQIPKIKKVIPDKNKTLYVVFSDGTKKLYDCNQLLNRPEFALLKNEAFFQLVKVDPGGYGISWNKDIDLSEYELWINGVDSSSTKKVILH